MYSRSADNFEGSANEGDVIIENRLRYAIQTHWRGCLIDNEGLGANSISVSALFSPRNGCYSVLYEVLTRYKDVYFHISNGWQQRQGNLLLCPGGPVLPAKPQDNRAGDFCIRVVCQAWKTNHSCSLRCSVSEWGAVWSGRLWRIFQSFLQRLPWTRRRRGGPKIVRWSILRNL